MHNALSFASINSNYYSLNRLKRQCRVATFVILDIYIYDFRVLQSRAYLRPFPINFALLAH